MWEVKKTKNVGVKITKTEKSNKKVSVLPKKNQLKNQLKKSTKKSTKKAVKKSTKKSTKSVKNQ